MIADANPDELLAIIEVCHNIVNSKFPITQKQKIKMMPYRDTIRRLSRIRSEKNARRILQRGGGAAGVIFSAVLVPVLSEVVRYFLDKNKKPEK